MPNMKMRVPPSTKAGTIAIIAPIFGRKAITIRMAPAAATTYRLPTPVNEIAPTFWSYETNGTPPKAVAMTEPRPSPAMAPPTRASVASTPSILQSAIVMLIV